MATPTKVASDEELLREILLRLPVKPLLRFKCVSKHWLSLISNPQFCHSHTLRQYHTPHPFPSALLLGTTPSSRCPIIPLKGANSDSSSNFRYLKVPRMSITIMQSCNGLLLLEGKPLQRRLRHPQNARHFIYNPTTNKFVALTFPTHQFGTSVLAFFLSFEPLRSPHYKVISIRFRNFSNFNDMLNYVLAQSTQRAACDYILNVYSSETGSWSDPGVCFTVPDFRSAVYCNGAIYWNGDAVNGKYFDVENQCFKTFPMPCVREDQISIYFGESRGHLHVIVKSILNLELDILELKQDCSEWFVRFHVNLDPIRVAFPRLNLKSAHMDGSFYVFCIVHQEKEEDSMLVFFVNGRVMAYNLVGCSFKSLSRFDPFLSAGSRFDVFHYYENLSWVGSSNA